MSATALSLEKKEHHDIHIISYYLALCAAISALLGIVRDKVLATLFGAGTTLDIYFAAFKIPDIFTFFLISLISWRAIVPVLSRKRKEDTLRETIDNLFSLFFIFLIIVATGLFFAIPVLSTNVFGFDDSSIAMLILISRLFLLQVIFISINNFLLGLTQYKRKYIIFGVTNILYTLGVLIGLTFLYPFFGIFGAVYGVIFGAALQLIIQLLTLKNEHILPRFHIGNIKKTLRIMLSSAGRSASVFMTVAVLFIFTIIASYLQAGSITIFTFASNITNVLYGVFGFSYTASTFALFSHYASENYREKFYSIVSSAMSNIIFWTLPFFAGIVLLRAHIVRIIFGAGAFDWVDTRLTSAVLAILAITVLLLSLNALCNHIFSALHKTYHIVISAFIMFITATTSCLVLVTYSDYWNETVGEILRIGDIDDIRVVALPIAYVIGVASQTLYLLSQKTIREAFNGRIKRSLLHIISSTLLMGAVILVTLRIFAPYIITETFVGLSLQAITASVAGVIVWGIYHYIVGTEEFFNMWNRIIKIKRYLITKTIPWIQR